MYAKISVILVRLKPFIPHDNSLIISVTCSHSSILSLLKTDIFSDFHFLHRCGRVVIYTKITHLEHVMIGLLYENLRMRPMPSLAEYTNYKEI